MGDPCCRYAPETASASGNLKDTWAEYSYRADNRLTGFADSSGQQWQYRYDPLGRRTQKERVAGGHQVHDVWKHETTAYLGFTHTVVGMRTDIASWNDRTSQSELFFYTGPGGRAYGARESYERPGKAPFPVPPAGWKNRRYYHYDVRGSVSAVSLDRPGLSDINLKYSAFGSMIAGGQAFAFESNNEQHTGFLAFGFTGKRYDRESGLYHFPYRDYDPLAGQWLTEDPIKDGLLWHAYVSHNPINFTDPLGLYIIAVAGDTAHNLRSDPSIRLQLGRGDRKNITIQSAGCVLEATVRIARSISRDSSVSLADANRVAIEQNIYTSGNLLSTADQARLISALTGQTVRHGSYSGSEADLIKKVKELDRSDQGYYVTARIGTFSLADNAERYDHMVNIHHALTQLDYHMGRSEQSIVDTSTRFREVISTSHWREGPLEEFKRVDYFYIEKEGHQCRH